MNRSVEADVEGEANGTEMKLVGAGGQMCRHPGCPLALAGGCGGGARARRTLRRLPPVMSRSYPLGFHRLACGVLGRLGFLASCILLWHHAVGLLAFRGRDAQRTAADGLAERGRDGLRAWKPQTAVSASASLRHYSFQAGRLSLENGGSSRQFQNVSGLLLEQRRQWRKEDGSHSPLSSRPAPLLLPSQSSSPPSGIEVGERLTAMARSVRGGGRSDAQVDNASNRSSRGSRNRQRQRQQPQRRLRQQEQQKQQQQQQQQKKQQQQHQQQQEQRDVVRTVHQPRAHVFDLSDFGAVGDGKTDNTRAFQNAIFAVSTVAEKGGGQLYVPPGRYVTGCFNLTSAMTLYLARDAVILGNPNVSVWQVLPPLPSYGRGREMPGPRYSSLIYGHNLTDVLITGENGTIDGQGEWWWNSARNGTLAYSRGPLLQLLWCTNVNITNITLVNSPYWTIHPVYCSNVGVSNVTITTPDDAPNAGGIYPDSSTSVLVEKSRISTGDDCVNVKSGWDQYGLAVGRASKDVVVRGCELRCPACAALSIGSEMSGGVDRVVFEGIRVRESKAAFRLKTCPGRGGYVTNVMLRGVVLVGVEVAFSFLPTYGGHPDTRFDPSALPNVAGFVFDNVTGTQVGTAGSLIGLPNAPFREINVTHVNLGKTVSGFTCKDVQGWARDVKPPICDALKSKPKVVRNGMGNPNLRKRRRKGKGRPRGRAHTDARLKQETLPTTIFVL